MLKKNRSQLRLKIYIPIWGWPSRWLEILECATLKISGSIPSYVNFDEQVHMPRTETPQMDGGIGLLELIVYQIVSHVMIDKVYGKTILNIKFRKMTVISIIITITNVLFLCVPFRSSQITNTNLIKRTNCVSSSILKQDFATTTIDYHFFIDP